MWAVFLQLLYLLVHKNSLKNTHCNIGSLLVQSISVLETRKERNSFLFFYSKFFGLKVLLNSLQERAISRCHTIILPILSSLVIRCTMGQLILLSQHMAQISPTTPTFTTIQEATWQQCHMRKQHWGNMWKIKCEFSWAIMWEVIIKINGILQSL